MPIHVRAEKGDYAEACLVPGDPLRAKYIAETFLEGAEQKNWERGMLGYTGTFNGKPVSVQSTGMGCPSAAIVIEELVMLGVKRILRIGTCGGLQPDLKLGDLIVAVSAVPQDSTAVHYLAGEAHTPTADWELVHGAVHAAKELGKPVRVGPIVSSDIFYDPDKERARRWSERGILAVEMEAAVLFTLGALRKVHAGCLLTVSDIVVEGGEDVALGGRMEALERGHDLGPDDPARRVRVGRVDPPLEALGDAVGLRLLAPDDEERPDDPVLAADLDAGRRPARREAEEDRLDLVGGGVAGRAQPPGADRVAQVAKLRLGRAGRRRRGEHLRPEPLDAEAGVLLGLLPAQAVVHVQRGDRVAELAERVPEAGGVRTAGDEARHLAAGRDQVVPADVLLDAHAQLRSVHAPDRT